MPGVGRGLLRDDNYLVFDGIRNFQTLSPDVQSFLRTPQLMMISKSNRKSTVHRPAQLDTIGIKTFDAGGQVVGQRLIVGLFTSASYNHPPHSIPVLRRKVQRCLEHSGFESTSHDGKALQHILDSYPRDELFQIEERELFATALGILHLQERQRIALFARKDPFERFISALVYVPRDRYNDPARVSSAPAARRERSAATIASHGDAARRVALRPRSASSSTTTPGQVPEVDLRAAVETRLIEIGRTWSERLTAAAIGRHGAQPAMRLAAAASPMRCPACLYRAASPPQTRSTTSTRIEVVEADAAGRSDALSPRRRRGATEPAASRPSTPGPAGASARDVLPMLENLGLRVLTEIPFEVRPRGRRAAPTWIQEFQLASVRWRRRSTSPRSRALFHDGFPAVWRGPPEDDGFNRLILTARPGAGARSCVLRAYCKLLRQAGSSFSQKYMEDTARRHIRPSPRC